MSEEEGRGEERRGEQTSKVREVRGPLFIREVLALGTHECIIHARDCHWL